MLVFSPKYLEIFNHLLRCPAAGPPHRCKRFWYMRTRLAQRWACADAAECSRRPTYTLCLHSFRILVHPEVTLCNQIVAIKFNPLRPKVQQSI